MGDDIMTTNENENAPNEAEKCETPVPQLAPCVSYPVWSPFDAYAAADTLMRELDGRGDSRRTLLTLSASEGITRRRAILRSPRLRSGLVTAGPP